MRTLVIGSEPLRQAVRSLHGQGFELMGAAFPQPLITVLGKPVIDTVGIELPTRRSRRALSEAVGPDIIDEINTLADQLDLILWGFTDEATPLWRFPDGHLGVPPLLSTPAVHETLRHNHGVRASHPQNHDHLLEEAVSRISGAITSQGLARRVHLLSPLLGEPGHAAARSAKEHLPESKGLTVPGAIGDEVGASVIARALHARAASPRRLVPPQPWVERLPNGTIQVRLLPTVWSENYAIDVLRDGKLFRRLPVQESPTFQYSPSAGNHQIQAYYYAADETRTSSSSRVFAVS